MQLIKTKEELLALDTELMLRAIQKFPTEKYNPKLLYRLIITKTESTYLDLFWFTTHQYGDIENSIDYDWMITLTMIYK